jgi:CHASE3 domain sensor protein
MSRKALSDDIEDGAMEPRVRKLEVKYATMAQQVDSLFDNGSPGILSQIRNALSDKIDSYFQTVSKFIEGEPARKAHIENNAHQAVADAKALALQAVADAKLMAKEALEETEREQNRMHQENRKTSEKAELEVGRLREDFSRHEKFVQRGIGILIFSQITIIVGTFFIAALTFVGGAAWWIFTHVPITK